MTETWRSVLGASGFEVSNFGRVRRVTRELMRPEYDRTNRRAYPRVRIRFDSGAVKRKMVHELVATAFIGPCPKGMQRNHKDGNKANACADNLEYVTPSQNVRHSIDVLGKHTGRHGSHHGMAVLTEPMVLAIYAKRLQRVPLTEIAKEFNVSAPTVSMIAKGRIWKHLQLTPIKRFRVNMVRQFEN